MTDENKLKDALNAVYRFLSYRDRSKKEVEQKLKEKGFEKSIIQNALTYLQENNYVDDRKFARQWGQSKISNNFYGKYFLEKELLRKGVDADIVNEVIEELYSETGEIKIAEQLSLKKMKSYKNLDPETGKRRLSSLLQRKGFSTDVVYKVVEKFTG